MILGDRGIEAANIAKLHGPPADDGSDTIDREDRPPGWKVKSIRMSFHVTGRRHRRLQDAARAVHAEADRPAAIDVGEFVTP